MLFGTRTGLDAVHWKNIVMNSYIMMLTAHTLGAFLGACCPGATPRSVHTRCIHTCAGDCETHQHSCLNWYIACECIYTLNFVLILTCVQLIMTHLLHAAQNNLQFVLCSMAACTQERHRNADRDKRKRHGTSSYT